MTVDPSTVTDTENDSHPGSNPNNSLIIPITSSSKHPPHSQNSLFIEIFPEEVPSIPSSTLISVLRDEDAPLDLWADAALWYFRQKREREGGEMLMEACEREDSCAGDRLARVRVLASAGIAHLTRANGFAASGSGGVLGSDGKKRAGQVGERNEELRGMAEDKFNKATRVDQFFPMTWVGKGMLNLSIGRIDQARFFFDTTLKQCGQVLPALLGMAAVRYSEGEYKEAQDYYAKAMTLFPKKSGAPVRVGFGMCCYKLGQVDRAKAAFRRAHSLDPENVEAMVGCAVLDLAGRDENSKDFNSTTEKAIKLMSMANMLDNSNAMIQNHLANHYFWKWSQVPGTVSVESGSVVVKGSQTMILDPGERVRIGQKFETVVVMEENMDGGSHLLFHIKDPWKGASETGLKLWKKDYERVKALAKGAHSSTTEKEIQAESLFTLARVYHVREDYENANKFYEKACKAAPDLSPARFGLAQTLVWDEKFLEASAHLRLILGTSSAATDALAVLGLLEIKSGKDIKSGLTYLKKAVDLDPLNPELVLLEAFAMRQQESHYGQSLDKYKRAMQLMENSNMDIPYGVLTNMGVLCHETRKYKEAMEFYSRALKTLCKERIKEGNRNDEDMDENDVGDCRIKDEENALFWMYADTSVTVVPPLSETKVLKLIRPKEQESALFKLSKGSHIRIGNDFQTEIIDVTDSQLILKNSFVAPITENVKKEEDDMETEEPEPKPIALFVKKINCRLQNPSAISITFNIARLHESTSKTFAAIELHKALVKKHPSYVNSYLRLACISRDVGSIPNCSEWLRSACKVAPGNPEVLTLVGNLHLSLCDWAPSQSVFEQLLATNDPSVHAYSQLSLGNIYFNNLNTPKKYTKHLQYASKFYRNIIEKDKANAYAANGLGTVLAEKGELTKAKEAFHRVREVSGDTIPDTLLNLGHIYLAQKKHPEALQMYQSYMSRTTNIGAAVTSKSREEDDAEVLLYIAFAYFDWAVQTEACQNVKAAPADERYSKCIEYIETAMKCTKKENVLLRYNWCRARLQAANCVLRKLSRNIRRTAKEVQDALAGLEESLPVVQKLLSWKNEGKRIPIATTTLNDFIVQCKENIELAKLHLSDELKKEAELNQTREILRMEALQQQKEKELQKMEKDQALKRERNRKEQRARANMIRGHQIGDSLIANNPMKQDKIPKKNMMAANAPSGDIVEEDGIFDNEVDVDQTNTAALFDDDSSDEEDAAPPVPAPRPRRNVPMEPAPEEKDLFGASSSEEDSDEEVLGKRGRDDDEGGGKKRKVLEEGEESE